MMTTMNSTTSELTNAQARAVVTESRETLVLAGAGSGKTKTLVERIKWLLQHGSSPADLLVLTFTRKAATEMRDRLSAATGNDRAVREMLLGTFHSIALKILRTDGDKLG
ncbi:MAG: UvrD-helicase domain-containing protein, partial [Planctomycetaceae bacterium]